MATKSHQTTAFNEAQLDLLDMLSHVKTSEVASALRQAISDYFALKVEEEMNRLWVNGEMTEEKVESFRHLHERTPYRAVNP